MSNVINLFGQRKIEDRSNPESMVTLAVADVLASHTELVRTIKELSKHLDVLDHITDAVSDPDVRVRFKQEAKRSRESLTNAMVDLSQ